MKESKPIYAIWDYADFTAIVWETELGKIVTCEGKVSPRDNLTIKSVETGEEVANVDLRNVLMSILPKE